ncbi:MAG: glycosyltransferase [Calditerrivibrio sp.]|nr:glycosyltransferase [Calditerrivibrio sp.]
MQKDIFFSVVIPVYNRVSLLKNTLESVFLQTYKHYEIIVIDDGSNIDLAYYLKPYLYRIRYIKYNKNRGVSYARNVGINNAKYEYIAFLDSDDIWLPNKLSLQASYLTKTGYLVCHTDEYWYKKDRFINPKEKHQRYGGHIFKYILDFCRISPSSAVIHKTVFNKVGLFDETLPICEDYDMWLRIANKFEIGYLPIKTIIKITHTEPQLSLTTPHIEYYRLISLCKILKKYIIPNSLKKHAIIELERKFDIVKNGIKSS